MVFGCFIISYHQTHSPTDIENPVLGYGLAIIAAILVAFMSIGLRKMNQSVHFLIFPFYFIVGLLIVCFLACCFSENAINIHKYTAMDLLTNCISSVGSLGGLVFMSQAFRHAEASQLVPLGSIQNIFNFLAEFYLLSYDFNMTDLLGAVILTGAFLVPILANLRYQTNKL